VDAFIGTDRFEVRRCLGSGSFGIVFEAFDRERSARVALKLPHEESAQGLYLFKQEFRSLADITHFNLINLYELLTIGGRWFFSMEFVEGTTFLDHLRGSGASPQTPTQSEGSTPRNWDENPSTSPIGSWDPLRTDGTKSHGWAGLMQAEPVEQMRGDELPAPSPPLDYERVRKALLQLAEGLSSLHASGKLHRDLKPSNVLVTRKGRVVILDFGLALDTEPEIAEDSEVFLGGTPAYMAPEQFMGTPGTPASDWYAVGVMLYQALTGRVPFPGKARKDFQVKLQQDPVPPGKLVPSVPADLNALCMALLIRDPEARMQGPEILQRLNASPASASALLHGQGGRAAASLVGRETELEALLQAFRTTKEGRSMTALLHGQSGMGKSFLVQCFLREVRKKEPQVVLLLGRCYVQESVPFKAVDSLVDSLSQYLKRLAPEEVEPLMPPHIQALAKLFPVLHQVPQIRMRDPEIDIPDAQELRRRAFGALRELLRRITRLRPVLLFIDDLQWGDLDSVALLNELVRPPAPPPLLLLMSYRSEEAESSAVLQELLPIQSQEAESCVEVVLRELDHARARTLSLALLGSGLPDAEQQAEWIASESTGSPFFIEELARHMRRLNEEPSGTSPHRLDDYIRIRVAALPEDPRRILETLAIAGYPLVWDILSTASAVDQGGITALNHLRAGHLVRIRSGREGHWVETYHDRIREAVFRSVSSVQISTTHLRLALVLESSPSPDPQALAMHFEEGKDSVKAAHYAAVAGDQASAILAFGRACELYRKALDLHLPADAEVPSLWKRLGDALANAGRSAEAAAAYLRAVEGAPFENRNRLQRRAAEEYFRCGKIDAGIATLEQVLDSVGTKLPGSSWTALVSLIWHRLRLWVRGMAFQLRPKEQIPVSLLNRVDIYWAAAMGLGPVDILRGADFQTRQLLLTLEAGEPFRVVRALAHELIVEARHGNRSQKSTQKLLAVTLDLAEQIGHPNPRARAFMAGGIVAMMEGRWVAATELLEQAEATLKQNCTGMDYELRIAQLHDLLCHAVLGNLRLLSERLPALLQEAKEQGDLMSSTNLRAAISYILSLAKDQPDQARRELESAIAAWSTSAFHLQHYHWLVSRINIELYAGCISTARTTLMGQWGKLRGSLLLSIQASRITMHELRARTALALAWELGASRSSRSRDITDLKRDAARSIRAIRKERTAYGEALALKLLGLQAEIEGRAGSAGEHYRQAAAGFEACDMKLHAAAVRWCMGRLENDGDRACAEALMQDQGIVNPVRFAKMHVPV